jgi:hypothetical protein
MNYKLKIHPPGPNGHREIRYGPLLAWGLVSDDGTTWSIRGAQGTAALQVIRHLLTNCTPAQMVEAMREGGCAIEPPPPPTAEAAPEPPAADQAAAEQWHAEQRTGRRRRGADD